MSFTDEEYRIIIENLKSEDIDQRRMAAEDLGYSGNEDAAFELVNYLNDNDKSVRDAVSGALKKVSNEKACFKIAKFFSSDKIDVRNYAVDILTSLNKTAIPSLRNSLKDNDYDIRKFAVDILGNLKATSSNSDLITMLNDPNDNVLVSVIEALGNIGQVESAPELMKIIDRGLTIKATVIEALGKIGSKEVSNFILTTINDEDSLISFLSIETIGKIGNRSNLELLVNYLSSKDELFISPLLISILRICNRENISILDTDTFSILKEKDTLKTVLQEFSIRKILLDNFNSHLSVENFDKLSNLVQFFDKDIKNVILEKMKENYSRKFEYIILELLDDKDNWIVYKASELVGEYKILNAENILIKHLESEEELVLISAIKNLGKIKSLKSKSRILALNKAIENEDINNEIKYYIESLKE